VTAQEQQAFLAQLEAPFAAEEIKWRVTHTTRDGKKGAVLPYVDQRAYTDRLNRVFTPSGWTREYIVTTVSNICRMKDKDRSIQTGKIIVTCIVTIPGVGVHTGSGEEWADDDNAMTRAEAQAFKRSCSCFGLGRYFYNFGEQWVELDDYRRPKRTPQLIMPGRQQRPDEHAAERPKAADSLQPSSRLDDRLTGRIEGYKEELGDSLYQEVLTIIGKAQTARSLPSVEAAEKVLHWLERALRGIEKARDLGSDLSVGEFGYVLDQQRVRNMNSVPTLKALSELVNALEAAHKQPRAA
jgi:hypothetical protein